MISFLRSRSRPRASRSTVLLAAVLALLALVQVIGPIAAQSPAGSPAPSVAATIGASATAGPTLTPAVTPLITAAPSAGPSAGPTAAPSPAPSAVASSTPSPAPSAGMAPGASPTPTAPPCPNPTPGPVVTPAPGATPAITPHPNLCPAQPNGADPISLLSWAFTPIFQVLFMGLALFYNLTRDVGIAIILLTIAIRVLLVPVFRAQIVSQRRMQMLQPELKAIQLKYKGNRTKISEEQMKLYKDRGVNPASGCLPALLQLVLLEPMYQVFSKGLNAPDISSMLSVFGNPVLTVSCQDPGNPMVPCIDPTVPWLAWMPRITGNGLEFYPGGLPANLPEIFLMVLPGLFGLSLLALAAALLQLVQTRMMATQTDDPQVRTQQRIFLILPLFSLFYGWFLPAGLFIYWITTTIFSIVQQYLINGWGGLFPLFGWTPRFAKNHTPRFPVKPLTPPVEDGTKGSGGLNDSSAPASARRSATDSAAGTIKPARGRSSRRGRRR